MEEDVMTYPGSRIPASEIDYPPIEPATGKTEAESGSVINRLFNLEQKVDTLLKTATEQAKHIEHIERIVGVKFS